MSWRRWLKRAGLAVLALALLGFAVLFATSDALKSFGGTPDPAQMKKSPRWSDGSFHNLEPTRMLTVSGTKMASAWLFGGDKLREPNCPLPMDHADLARFATPPESGLRLTWLGHSTVLIEIDGKRLLTDPQWSERTSPSTALGPKRFHPPPVPLERLPKLDAVLVSHDHYDHLDMSTVRALAKTGVVFHVGLGVGAHLKVWGVPDAQVVEHEWWQEADLGGLKLVSTPARHFSGRGFGRDLTSWTSWSLVGPTHRVFFSGDSGMTPSFSAIADKLGPFDVAMLEIGQWHPTWGDIHLGPRGALDAFALLGAKKLLPIHWATFELGLHSWSEPAETLYVEGQKRGVPLLTPLLAQSVELETPTTPWWRALPPTASGCPPP